MWLLIILIILLYLYLPQKTKKFDQIKNSYLAHRGFYDNGCNIPENSLLAFKKAKEKGYGCELDVQLTKDKKVVVFHDDDLRRMANCDKRIKDLTYDQLQKYELLNSKEKIPLLSDVLDLYQGKYFLCIEIKHSGLKGLATLCQAVSKLLADYPQNYGICSFNPIALLWFRIFDNKVFRIITIEDYSSYKMNFFQKLILQYSLLNIITRPHGMSYEYDKTNISFSIFKKARGYTLGWSIGSKEEAIKNKDKFDCLIFEHFDPFTDL